MQVTPPGGSGVESRVAFDPRPVRGRRKLSLAGAEETTETEEESTLTAGSAPIPSLWLRLGTHLRFVPVPPRR